MPTSWKDHIDETDHMRSSVPPFPGLGRDTSKYLVRGERVPSVTEVIQAAGGVDFSDIAPGVLENAANRGKWVHYGCELIDAGKRAAAILRAKVGTDCFNEELAPRLVAYERFLGETGWVNHHSELLVRHLDQRYCGTLDRVGNLPGGDFGVLDIKLPAMSQPAWGLQLSAYLEAFNTGGDRTLTKRYSLQLHKNGRYELSEPKDSHIQDFIVFLAMNRVAHWKIRHNLLQLAA